MYAINKINNYINFEFNRINGIVVQRVAPNRRTMYRDKLFL